MRISSNRRSIEKLFVLGAGASLAASEVATRDGSTATYQAPLDAEFPKRIADVDLKKPHWISEAAQTVVQKFRPEGDFENYPLEEGITRQLGLLQFFNSIHPRRSRKQIRSSEWLNLLAHLICVILRRTRENSSAVYTELAKRRFPGNKSADELSDSIITFNYDTLLDSILLKDREPTDLYFDEIRERRDRPSKTAKQEAPILLKLHGSINWRCREESLQAMIEGAGSDDEPYDVPTIWMDNSRPPSPEDDASPLIIPPLPSKPITSIRIFKWLWKRAYEYLYEAEELVVIGYSLPPADQLADSMFGAFRSKQMERVVIVDPSTTALDRWRQVLKRSGLGSVRWTYYETFEDYLEVDCQK